MWVNNQPSIVFGEVAGYYLTFICIMKFGYGIIIWSAGISLIDHTKFTVLRASQQV